MIKLVFTILNVCCLTWCNIYAQDKLYPNEFPLSDVKLLEGTFKHARDLNIQTILKYNVDRLLAGYRKQAGLQPRDSIYKNWDGLDGHVGGHYLSALAMNYAATKNSECKKRMDYMIAELKACQDANSKNNPSWGIGYAGAVPNSKEIWSTLKIGDLKAYRSAWVPWYNVHKMFTGLRDAWLYADNQDAKTIFLKFCDWAIDITSALSDEQMQSMLDVEHGGMNEIFADAYQITKNEKYLTAAKRFSHKMLLDAMAVEKDNLDNKHANTQVPKAIGFARIGEVSNDDKFSKAGNFFWQTVTTNRSLAFGGNSRREFFPSVAACSDFINDVEGPESCNSYNMLKLTEDLFRKEPSAKYIDYYERTLYNHILSTQHPVHGGYVYFTPARPQHYRVYSSPNEGMWCCVGSGMENHSKYNEVIYTHQHDSLYLNLFIASELNWKEKEIKIKQETQFPFEEQTKFTISEGNSDFTLMIRYPSWVKEGALKVFINGNPFSFTSAPSLYIAVKRKWTKGDVVKVILPMHNSLEHLPNVSHYIAIMHGPILLGAKTGTEDLKGLVADDSRWGHIASGKRLPVDKAPIIIEDNISSIASKLKPIPGKPLMFSASLIKMANPISVTFEPFFKVHDSRYMMYWMALTNSQYRLYMDSITDAANKAHNPVIFADVPDASMIRVGDTYYMSSTTMHMSPGLPIMSSKDLVNWKLVSYCYDTLVSNDDMNLTNGKSTYGRGSWASSIRYHNGTYYVSTFAATSGKTHIYTTKNIEKGSWKAISFRPSLHDHSLFFDDDGKTYMLYGNRKLTLVELNADLSGIKEGGVNQVVVENATQPTDSIAASNLGEGSQLFKVNGKYYLFNITWPRGGMRTVVIHRADKITGPYEGRIGLQDLGVAQGGLIDMPNGTWYSYLFRDYGAVGRIPYLVPVKWEDGWPMLGVNGKAPETLDLPAIKGLIPNIVASDEFDRKSGEPRLPLVWQWNHNPDNKLWSITARKGYLRLTTGRIDTSILLARNMLTQRTFGPVCSGSTSLNVSKMKDGDFAGLCLLQKNYGAVGVKVNGNSKLIVVINAGSGTPVEVTEIPLSQDMLYFKAKCDFTNKKDMADFFYSLDGKKWIPIGTQLKMTYTLPHFMGYRFGLFNYSTKTTGGFVDFDWFRIKPE